MDKIIKVSDYIKNGLTESNGFILRDAIRKEIETANVDRIILDFSNITLFATPFFNASIGYYILNLGPDQFNKKIELKQMTSLGLETYQHSYNNAVEIYNKKTNIDDIGEITKNNIENS